MIWFLGKLSASRIKNAKKEEAMAILDKREQTGNAELGALLYKVQAL